VDFADEAQRERHSRSQTFLTVGGSRDIVGHFLHIPHWNAGHLLTFEEKQVGERRLHAFNLRRQHRFFADIVVQKQGEIRQQK